MTRPTTNTFVSSREAAKHFTRKQDEKILRLRAGGMSFADIAIAFPGRTPLSIRRRHQRLTFTPQKTPAETNDDGVPRHELRKASDALLRRQLATGQFNAAQRAAWLARHGEAA